MPEAYISQVANRLGALALTLADDIREATEMATGLAGGMPAALVSLHEWADGRSVDVLAYAMRVSHSRAVRVVDRLEADGLARRETDPQDGRRALVRIEPAGRELAERALEARERVLERAVAGIDDPGELDRQLEALLYATTVDRPRRDGDVPAVQRARLRARRRPVPGHPRRRSLESAGVIRAVAVFALAAIAPLLIGGDVEVLHNMILAAAYAVMALGLNIIVGFAGLLDLGYVAFFAIGAYTAAYFASGYWDIHLNFLLVLVLAVVTTGVAGR